jgi:NAD(P)-dependent dehydrogenase (short-subunit alcohol dehydrogenase family)
MTDYRGRRVVVTGGTSGIGLATAQLFVSGGAHVVVTGRSPGSLERARRDLGPDAVVVAGDAVTGIDELGRRVSTELGGVDLLVLNAGRTVVATVEDTTTEQFDDLFALNTKAPLFTLQRLLPLMPSGSSAVLVTSVSNVKGIAGTGVYSATKAALRSLVRTAARELAGRGIRVNAVSPGPVDTGILERTMPADEARQFLDQMSAANPMGRLGEPVEVAKAIAYLGFDATYTTGTELHVDGGAAEL